VRRIRALLCDLDGVVRHWPEEGAAAVEREHGLPAGALAAAAFEPALLRAATTGEITDEEWRSRIAAALAAEYGDQAQAAVEAWNALDGILDAEMLALLAEVRAAVPVVLVTNATTRLEQDLRAAGLEGRFDAVANSAELGVAKPDRLMFERAAGLVGVPLSDCAVVDDRPSHLEQAREAGAAVVCHESVDRTRAALVALGLPLRP
jgi:putative hydrolase of the HAD superfamily